MDHPKERYYKYMLIMSLIRETWRGALFYYYYYFFFHMPVSSTPASYVFSFPDSIVTESSNHPLSNQLPLECLFLVLKIDFLNISFSPKCVSV